MKTMTKFLVMILVVTMVTGIVTINAANFEKEADALKSLGLFLGTDLGYELDRTPDRLEAGVMLIRLLGKEEEALACTAKHPFTDVPSWGDSYVAYLYSEGLSRGMSETIFGSNEVCTANMYITFVLRAMGYNDAAGDFSYEGSPLQAINFKLISKDYYDDFSGRAFMRDDLVAVSYKALFTNLKNSDKYLLEKLLEEDAVPADTAEEYISNYRKQEEETPPAEPVGEYRDIEQLYNMRNAAYEKNYAPGDLSMLRLETLEFLPGVDNGKKYITTSDIKIKNVRTPQEMRKYIETYESDDGEYSFELFEKDGYSYRKTDSGIKTYNPINQEAEAPSGLTLKEEYKSANIKKVGENTVITFEMSYEHALIDLHKILVQLTGPFFNKEDIRAVIWEANDIYTINPDGYIIEYKQFIASNFSIKGMTAFEYSRTIENTMTLTYREWGKNIQLEIPSDLGEYVTHEEHYSQFQ